MRMTQRGNAHALDLDQTQSGVRMPYSSAVPIQKFNPRLLA